jgi:hypothetical protein
MISQWGLTTVDICGFRGVTTLALTTHGKALGFCQYLQSRPAYHLGIVVSVYLYSDHDGPSAGLAVADAQAHDKLDAGQVLGRPMAQTLRPLTPPFTGRVQVTIVIS